MMSKMTARMILVVAMSLVLPFIRATGQQPSNPQQGKAGSTEALFPLHDAHRKAHGDKGITANADSQMKNRGESEKGMRFSQSATTHHFLIKANGGVIQVEANDPQDVANRGNIRRHLAHIAEAFANGDFDIPMFVHDTLPPGVSEMKRLRERIHYTFEQTPSGGYVVITTPDKESLTAIHKFLRFQIEEHRTGDLTQVH